MFNIGDLLTYRRANNTVWILLGVHETVRGIRCTLKVLDGKDSPYKSCEFYRIEIIYKKMLTQYNCICYNKL